MAKETKDAPVPTEICPTSFGPMTPREFYAHVGTSVEDQMEPVAESLLRHLRNRRGGTREGDAAFKRMVAHWLDDYQVAPKPKLNELLKELLGVAGRARHELRASAKYKTAALYLAMSARPEKESISAIARVAGADRKDVRRWRRAPSFQETVELYRLVLARSPVKEESCQ